MNAKVLGFCAACLTAGLCAATDLSGVPTSSTLGERIEALIKQNQILTEMVTSMKLENERPKTRQEVFAACMQAAKGAGAMAAESIGGHCDQLLKE